MELMGLVGRMGLIGLMCLIRPITFLHEGRAGS